MKNNRLILFGILIACLPLFLHSQSNAVIDKLLDTNQADWGKTSYLILTAAQLIDENADIAEAMTALDKQKWGINIKGQEEPVTLGEYSYLLMKAFDMTGGLMYRIVPGPRYAARELDYMGFIDTDKSPDRTLSGEEELRILGRFLEWKEANL
ncbi:MAG: hypothetical protein J7L71_04805 [Spirochaetaceae bacterium]|nr:hypothetical protein [Spirochaetaceae bacterium]